LPFGLYSPPSAVQPRLIPVIPIQQPKQNVSPKRHPNLAAAQRLCANACQKVIAAQQANERDMQGHAQRAKDLLDQADNELKQAGSAANKNN
jgi:hypothetical protein